MLAALSLALMLGACSHGPAEANRQGEPGNRIDATPTPASDGPPIEEPSTISDPSRKAPPAPERTGRWVLHSDGKQMTAAFGRPGSSPGFSVRCDRARESLIFYRASDEAPEPGSVANLNLSLVGGSTLVRSFDAGPRSSGYRGSMPLHDPWLDTLLAASGSLEINLGGRSWLAVPVSKELKRVVATCRRGG